MHNGGDERTVIVFGADWCGDCRHTRLWLRDHHIPFTERDVEHDAEARELATALADGRTNIPVVVLPNGSVLVEPSDADLASAFDRPFSSAQ